jgi:RHS repeat-associated protein
LIYDANGNLVSGDGKYRTYNGLNQLWKIYNGTNSSGLLLEMYQYHPTEERIHVKTVYNSTGGIKETVYYVSKSFVQVVNSSGSFNFTYVYQNGQLVAQKNPDGTKIFIHSDLEGSATVITNSSGQVIENTSYSPFGDVLSGGTKTRFGYEDKEKDSVVGDTDFNFRKYRADWGIFTQPDTLIQNVYDPQSLNHYMFERGNPYKYTDPSGHFLDTVLDIAFIVNDIKDIGSDSSNAWNYVALGVDVGCAILPGVAGGGLLVKGAEKGVNFAIKASKEAKAVETAAKINKEASALRKVEDASKYTKVTSDGRILEYDKLRPAKTSGPSVGNRAVKEIDSKTGESKKVWMETYNEKGQVTKVHQYKPTDGGHLTVDPNSGKVTKKEP